MPLAQIEWLRTPPHGTYRTQVKLPSDPPDHLYGQWTLVVIPAGRGLVECAFLMPDAPHAQLQGMVELYEGTKLAARITFLEGQ